MTVHEKSGGSSLASTHIHGLLCFSLVGLLNSLVMSNFGPDATCTVYCAPSLEEALHMGNHVAPIS